MFLLTLSRVTYRTCCERSGAASCRTCGAHFTASLPLYADGDSFLVCVCFSQSDSLSKNTFSTSWSRDEFRHGLLLFLIVKSELLCISGKIYIAVIHIHIAVNTAYRTCPRILPQEVCAVIVGLINVDICNPNGIL